MEAFKKNLDRGNKCSVCCVVKKYEEVMSLNSDQVVKIGIDTDH